MLVNNLVETMGDMGSCSTVRNHGCPNYFHDDGPAVCRYYL